MPNVATRRNPVVPFPNVVVVVEIATGTILTGLAVEVAVVWMQPICIVEVAAFVVVTINGLFWVVVALNVHWFVIVVRAVVAPSMGFTTSVNIYAPTIPPERARAIIRRYFMVRLANGTR